MEVSFQVQGWTNSKGNTRQLCGKSEPVPRVSSSLAKSSLRSLCMQGNEPLEMNCKSRSHHHHHHVQPDAAGGIFPGLAKAYIIPSGQSRVFPIVTAQTSRHAESWRYTQLITGGWLCWGHVPCLFRRTPWCIYDLSTLLTGRALEEHSVHLPVS